MLVNSPVAVATAGSIFDDVSNIYLFSTITLFVAIIIALYFSNFFKDEIDMAEHELTTEERKYQLYEEMASSGAVDVDVEAFNGTEILATDYDDDDDDVDDDDDDEDDEEASDGAGEAATVNDITYFRKNLQNCENANNFDRNLSQTDSNESLTDVDGAVGGSAGAGAGGGGLVGHLKSSRFKKLESKLTQEQLDEERRIEREQMAAIFELLKKQEADLNMCEIDEKELKAQMNLYR